MTLQISCFIVSSNIMHVSNICVDLSTQSTMKTLGFKTSKLNFIA